MINEQHKIPFATGEDYHFVQTCNGGTWVDSQGREVIPPRNEVDKYGKTISEDYEARRVVWTALGPR